MKFYTLREAQYFVKVCHSPEFKKKLRIVKCRHWSMDAWDYIPCYTVVMK